MTTPEEFEPNPYDAAWDKINDESIRVEELIHLQEELGREWETLLSQMPEDRQAERRKVVERLNAIAQLPYDEQKGDPLSEARDLFEKKNKIDNPDTDAFPGAKEWRDKVQFLQELFIPLKMTIEKRSKFKEN